MLDLTLSFWYNCTQFSDSLRLATVSAGHGIQRNELAPAIDNNRRNVRISSARPCAVAEFLKALCALCIPLGNLAGVFLFTHTAYRGNTAPPRNYCDLPPGSPGRQTEDE